MPEHTLFPALVPDQDPDPPLDPGEFDVDSLRDALQDGDYSVAELEAIGDAEEAGQERVTALDAVDDAIAAVREG